ncbi:hypothetical protein HYV86_06505 [Candidatus Woesearchaeota archaeon]|nr:hypothetical protein [Candidatus Woesearchaeota archaeon]
MLTEHSIKLDVELPKGDVTAKMPVFYNPVMVSNRNISILLLNARNKKDLKIADPLAGSGIRSLRFCKELHKGIIKEIHVNDMKPTFCTDFTNTLTQNHISSSTIHLSQEEASLFLLKGSGYDYLDIDPFGTPNPFLAAAVARISRGGILAVTATDTAALTGTYAKVTPRKYWAKPLKNHMMHEIGLRILIRRIQLQGIQFDKALVPILSYHKDHYFRVYCEASKGKERCDELLKQHQYFLWCKKCLSYKTSEYNRESCLCGSSFEYAGPLWTGPLFDSKLLKSMCKENPFSEEQKFLDTLQEESTLGSVGFYNLHEISRLLKINPPRIEHVLAKIKGVRTHCDPNGIKTKLSREDIFKVLEKL